MSTVSRRSLLGLAGIGVLGLAGCTVLPRAQPVASGAPDATGSSPAAPAFDRSAHSIDDPASLWVVVNKHRPIAAGYRPDVVDVVVPHTNLPLLRRAASTAVVALFAAAQRDGVHLASNSTYRSYADQRADYDGNVRRLGRATADDLTAHPGCSEHQTGLAIDIGARSGRCGFETCMGEEPEGRWLAAHAWRFGFLLRYPRDEVAVTGYQYEPWHFRYLGKPLATELHRTGVRTLEQFFGLPAAPGYA